MSGKGKGQEGFALIAALMAIFLLTVLGALVFVVSTSDTRVATRVVGEKKAMASAESGLHKLMYFYDPSLVTNTGDAACPGYAGYLINTGADADSCYSFSAPAPPISGPQFIAIPGFAISGGQPWGQARYTTSVAGINKRYNSRVETDAGVGFGPVEVTTAYR
ncbi:MAG TPA: pilus assembly PilX N-terminal domain-containing protein [Dissulfurispiraceae bacterium]|nr:pilus assembly PilX N-terminal domain-containing protein [Dissulfurispiraceae bacterium]